MPKVHYFEEKYASKVLYLNSMYPELCTNGRVL